MDELAKEFQLHTGRNNFTQLLDTLKVLDKVNPSSSMPAIMDVATAFDNLLLAHSGLHEEDQEAAVGALTVSHYQCSVR